VCEQKERVMRLDDLNFSGRLKAFGDETACW
jgi:hypothetical protein